jgi:hypothetical protein
MKIINTIRGLGEKIAFSHNGVHYTAARLLGIQITKDNKVWINIDWPIWKNIIIYIAPTLLGLFGVVGSFIGYARWLYYIPHKYIYGTVFILGCSWLGICFLDFVIVVHYLIFQRWLDL